jgi:hypothetical protein
MALEKLDDTTAIERVKQADVIVPYTVKELLTEQANLIQAINDVNAQFTSQIANLKARYTDIAAKLAEMEKLGIKEATEAVVEPIGAVEDLGG